MMMISLDSMAVLQPSFENGSDLLIYMVIKSMILSGGVWYQMEKSRNERI